jgi:hypothetical protein
MITLLAIVLLSQVSPFGSLMQTQSTIINSYDVNSGIGNFMGEMGGDKFIVHQPVQIPLKKSRYKNKRMPKMMSETACNENCICAKVTEAQGKEILEIINRSK